MEHCNDISEGLNTESFEGESRMNTVFIFLTIFQNYCISRKYDMRLLSIQYQAHASSGFSHIRINSTEICSISAVVSKHAHFKNGMISKCVVVYTVLFGGKHSLLAQFSLLLCLILFIELLLDVGISYEWIN